MRTARERENIGKMHRKCISLDLDMVRSCGVYRTKQPTATGAIMKERVRVFPFSSNLEKRNDLE